MLLKFTTICYWDPSIWMVSYSLKIFTWLSTIHGFSSVSVSLALNLTLFFSVYKDYVSVLSRPIFLTSLRSFAIWVTPANLLSRFIFMVASLPELIRADWPTPLNERLDDWLKVLLENPALGVFIFCLDVISATRYWWGGITSLEKVIPGEAM